MIKRFAALLSILLLFVVSVRAQENLIVVELFTSQGCKLCPPADKVLENLARFDDVLALSLPVDYWDYMGWKDTYGSEKNTAHQEAYNKQFGKRGVYTPQMVINGSLDVVGSRAEEVAEAVDKARKGGTWSIAASLVGTRDHLVLELGEHELESAVVLRLIWYDSEQIVDVKKGDNGGQLLHYTNVVRGSEILDRWNGASLSRLLDLDLMRESGANCVAVIIQDGLHGRILGAAKIVFGD